MSHRIMAHQDMAGSTTGPPWVEATAGGDRAIDRPFHPYMPPPTAPVPSRASGASPSIDRHLFPPTAAIRDPGVALRFAARLLAESPGSDLFVMLMGVWIQERYPYQILEPKGEGYAAGAFFDRIDELACELRRIGLTEASVYITTNPLRRIERGSFRNRFRRLENGRGAKVSDIEAIKFATLDIDPAGRKSRENSCGYQHGASLARMGDILANEPSIARSCMFGSSGNGAHMLIHLQDLPNDPENRAAVRSFVRAVAQKYPPVWTPVPGLGIYTAAEIDTDTHIAKQIGLCGSLKCKGPASVDRPRRVVELCGLDRDIPPFDLFGWLAANGVSVDVPTPEHQDDGSGAASMESTAPASQGNIRRRKRFVVEWLARQQPAVEGRKGDIYTFWIVKKVLERCFDLDDKEILRLLADWNDTCQPPWSECELRHKIDEARKVTKPRLQGDPLANYDARRLFDKGGVIDG